MKTKGKFTQGLKKVMVKDGLMTHLVLSFTIVIVVALSISGAATFLITKSKVVNDFKQSALQILNQNKNYIAFIDFTIENDSLSVLRDNDFKTFVKQLKDSKDNETQTDAANKLINILKNIGGNNGIIDSIYFVNDYNPLFSDRANTGSNNYDPDLIKKVLNSDAYKNALKLNGASYWMPPQKNLFVKEADSSTNKDFMTLIRIIKDDNTKEVLGTLQVNLSSNYLSQSLKSTKIGKNGYIYLVDENGNILAHKDETLLGKKVIDSYFSDIKKSSKKEGNFEFKQDGKTMYGVYSKYDNRGWTFIAAVPKSELSATATSIGSISIIIVLICIFLSIIIAFITARRVSKPITEIIDVTKQLAEGDFTIKAKKFKLREIDVLSNNFNIMIDSLKQMVSTTSNLAGETNNASNNILNISKDISDASKEVSAVLNDISAGFALHTENVIQSARISDNFNKEIVQTVNLFNDVEQATGNTTNVLNECTSIVNELSSITTDNSEFMDQVMVTITNLSKNTKSIVGILEKIAKLSAQTDLLSLNASIESARAGEAGRGFSIVANEIKKLAEQSHNATVEISKILNNVDEAIKQSSQISEKAQISFNQERIQVRNTIKYFDIIKESIDSITVAMNASKESMKVIDSDKEQLNKMINNIATVSEQSTAATEEITASVNNQSESNLAMYNHAKALNKKAEELKEVIGSFKF